MSKINTHLLHMFVVTAQTLNFRLAAEQLHITQPPLSRAIQNLEQRLGVKLFLRDTQNVQLTTAGKLLLPRALAILAMLDETETFMASLVEPSHLRLGLTTSVEAGSFNVLTQAVATAMPDMSVEITYDNSPKLVAAIKAGRVDAAVIAMPTRTLDFPVQSLGQQAMMVALASKHPLASRRQLSLADIASEPVYHFERARQPAFFDYCHEIFRQHHFAPRFLLEPNDHHVLLSDVASGKGIALLPASFKALRLHGVSYRKLKEGDELALKLALITGTSVHPQTDLLFDLASKYLQA
ncbi:LysR family transcriptional regulator [Undibacterium umbellatum]|uniref:LysR family transcriptional regulator n=1 Tax=Undibacterium umbellatum TaxID=2762300 RepID=A0ABR6Z7H9_9BURK|nr:LysR family transcriptional regulator [Undibacterium umbellatum]MBC3907714.1 LysR family transcriptional regulator [Undibacterium umbellatum]